MFLLMTCSSDFIGYTAYSYWFLEVKPVQAKAIIDAENTHKANIVVCRLVGFWFA